VTLTFFSLFGILSISSCELLLSVPIVYHEVDSALSFQTIFFSRFSALVVERSVVNRFPSAALLMYQLGLGLSSVFAENFKYFLQPYTARLFTVELIGDRALQTLPFRISPLLAVLVRFFSGDSGASG
jgi:hypothetical protein